MRADLLFPATPTLGLTIWSVCCFRGKHLLCLPSLAIGQSFSLFGFRMRGFEDLTEDFFRVSNFHNVFKRGSSKRRTSTTKINIYEDCLFKRATSLSENMARTHPTLLFPPLQLPTTDYGGIRLLLRQSLFRSPHEL